MWIPGLGWFPAQWCHPLRFPGTWDISLFWLIDTVPVLSLPCLPPDISLHVLEIKGHSPHKFGGSPPCSTPLWGAVPRRNDPCLSPFRSPTLLIPLAVGPSARQLHTIAEIGSNIPINQGPRPIPTPIDHGFCGVHGNCFACALTEQPLSRGQLFRDLGVPFRFGGSFSFSLFPPFFLSFLCFCLPPFPPQ